MTTIVPQCAKRFEMQNWDSQDLVSTYRQEPYMIVMDGFFKKNENKMR